MGDLSHLLKLSNLYLLLTLLLRIRKIIETYNLLSIILHKRVVLATLLLRRHPCLSEAGVAKVGSGAGGYHDLLLEANVVYARRLLQVRERLGSHEHLLLSFGQHVRFRVLVVVVLDFVHGS